MSRFDDIARGFDRYRAFPEGVPRAIRETMWGAIVKGPRGRVLDVGAGTGRIGQAFTSAGDRYFAVDPSSGMLAEFARKSSRESGTAPGLARADGRRLPFPDRCFDAVLIVQVMSGEPLWKHLLAEARRVLCREGALVLGKTVRSEDGLDARMRAQLSVILAKMGIDASRPGAGREEALDWLRPSASRIEERVAARWDSTRRPVDFLKRHATGARFASLPQPVKDVALERLSEWSVSYFGGLEASIVEPIAFVLDICIFDTPRDSSPSGASR